MKTSKNFIDINRRTNVVNIRTDAILNTVVNEVNLQVAKRLGNYATTFQRSLQQKKGLREANKEIADLAREAVLLRYLEKHSKRSPYRELDGDRYAGGVLLQTLANRQFIRPSASGIQFGNSKLLDANAKQWYRLNFGAGAKGEAAAKPKSTPMVFFNRTISSRASLDNYGPSSGFVMPSGFFSSDFKSATTGGKYAKPTGLDAFYLYKKGLGQSPGSKIIGKGTPTRGISPMFFLQAGTEVINTQYPKRVTSLIKKWESDARKSLNVK